LAKSNPETFLRNVAGTLSNLGTLYSDTHRSSEAENAFGEALESYKQLAKNNPAAFNPYLAIVAKNYAILLRANGRKTEAEQVESQAANP